MPLFVFVSCAQGRKIKCIPTCLIEQYATASPLKIKKIKNLRFLINCGFWKAEMVQWRKRSPSTNVARVRFRTPSHICTELVDYTIRTERFSFFFSPGIPLFPSNHKNYNFLACDWFKKGLFSTNSLAKLLSDSLLLDSLLLDSSNSQSHSKM